MLSLISSCLMWTRFHMHTLPQNINYYMEEQFCDKMLSNFWEDRFLSFRSLNCDDISHFVRNSFDAWQHNSDLSFYEVSNIENASLIIKSDSIESKNVLGFASSFVHETDSITIDSKDCWYRDNSFCYSLKKNQIIILVLFGAFWLLSMAAIVVLLFIPLKKIETIFRIVAWACFLAPPLILWGSILPCLQCYNFEVLMMHEIGHIIGLGHPDLETEQNQCGCGNYTACSKSNELSTMSSIIKNRPYACLSQDDVDGAKSIHGGQCSESLKCYQTVDYSGFSRLAIALLYTFIISWTVVSIRTCFHRVRDKKINI